MEAPLAALQPSVPALRALLLGGDFFLGAVIAAALTKLQLRLRALGGVGAAEANAAAGRAMLAIVSMLRLGEAAPGQHPPPPISPPPSPLPTVSLLPALPVRLPPPFMPRTPCPLRPTTHPGSLPPPPPDPSPSRP
jgi:hypothetical protein